MTYSFGYVPSRNAPLRNMPRPQAAEWSDLLVLDLRDLVDTLSEEEELVRAPTTVGTWVGATVGRGGGA